MTQLSPCTLAFLESIRRYEIMGHECSIAEVTRLAWLFNKQLLQAGMQRPFTTLFSNDQNDGASPGIRLFLESVLGTYLSEVRAISGDPEPRVFGISQRQGELINRHFETISPDLKTAVYDLSRVIDGYESPYGLAVLTETKN